MYSKLSRSRAVAGRSEEIREGKALLHLTPGVFYNPHMEFNRDLSVAAAAILRPPGAYADALCATGAMGIRVGKEAGLPVVLNDISPRAARLAQQNLRRNRVRGEVRNTNANILLHREHFDTVDLDPFGSPAPFLEAGARAARRLLAVTATDRAPLCGAHISGFRKYGAVPLNVEFHEEMGARVLLGAALRALARQDKGGTPLLTVSRSHFYRIWLQVEWGATRAEKGLAHLGYVSHCAGCGFRQTTPGLIPLLQPRCPECRRPLAHGGPLYLGPLHRPAFARKMAAEVRRRKFRLAREERAHLALCAAEPDIPFPYDIHVLCKMHRLSPGPLPRIIESLQARGHRAARSSMSPLGVRTDAPLPEMVRALRTSSKDPRSRGLGAIRKSADR